MQPMRGFVVQRLRVLALVALVLVPVTFSAHRHETASASTTSTCPVCLAVSHSPAVQSAAVPPLPPPRAIFAVAVPVITAPAAARPHRPTSRGPPFAVAPVSV
jgi:hypothetical protein